MKRFLVFLFILTMLFPVASVDAALDEEIWTAKKTNVTKKAWTISFNQEVNEKSASSKNIFVIDSHNQLFPTTITVSEDKMSVTVSPNKNYLLNEEYRLIIDRKVRSTSSKDLRKNIIMPFTVVPKSSGETSQDTNNDNSNVDKEQNNNDKEEEEVSLQVTVTLNDYVADITVKGGDTVTKVLVGKYRMHYAGNNTFNLGLADVEPGETLIIKAYDHKNKMLTQEKYKVE